MSNNFIRVLRNGTLYADRETAISNLNTKLSGLQDGEICLASYGATWDAAKTILGVVRFKTVDSVAKRSYTIFDNEANSAEIAAEIAKLDNTVTHTDSNKHVTVKVIEADGLLSSVEVTTADIASAALLGTKEDTSAVDTAFGRIAQEVADRTTAITNAIAALDSSVAATAESNNQLSVLTGVTQTDGVLTAKTEVTLAAVAKTGSAADVANAAIPADGTYVAVEGTNVSDQIASIAKTIKGITTTQSNAFKYITVKLSDTEVNDLPDASNVKEAYKVVAYIGESYANASTKETVGEVIKIYKDASIHKIYLGNSDDKINATTGEITKGQIVETKLSLNYAYILADGTYAMASIPVGNFLRQSEFKNGLQVTENGEVSVKVDAASEGFLTVGEAGVKVSGVQTAITTAIQGLEANVTGKSTGDHVTVQVIETAGEVTAVNVTTSGLALDSEVIKGVTVNGVDAQVSADKKAIVTINGANTAVSNAYVATEYAEPFETKVGANHIAAGDTVDAALKKTENTISVLATEVISNEKVTTAAITKLAESAGVVGADSVIGYQKKTDANYISEATSVHDATVKLDAAIKTVEGKITTLDGAALKSIEGSNAIGVTTKASNSQTVSLKLGTGTTGDNALVINADGLYLSNVWDCGEY